MITKLSINTLQTFPDIEITSIRLLSENEAIIYLNERDLIADDIKSMWFCGGHLNKKLDCGHRESRGPYLKGLGGTPEAAMFDALNQMINYYEMINRKNVKT